LPPSTARLSDWVKHYSITISHRLILISVIWASLRSASGRKNTDV